MSFTVQLFNFLRSIQNLRLPFFFLTRTTILAHGLCDFQMAPISSISWRWAFTSLYIWGYSSVVHFEGCPVGQLYSKFDEGCLSKVQVAVGKQVFSFDQQLPGLLLFLLWPLLQALQVKFLQDLIFMGPWVGFPKVPIMRITGGTWLGLQQGRHPGSSNKSVPWWNQGVTLHTW